jgi:hypothetical protein
MSLQDWERDVLNRQRNIVFPDTVLNQGRFFRHAFSNHGTWTFAQQLGILLVLLGMIGTLGFMGVSLFGTALATRGLLVDPAPAVKRRRGYRRSGRT